jgi:hypothetical protein
MRRGRRRACRRVEPQDAVFWVPRSLEGRFIESCPDDFPVPAFLCCSMVKEPIHVVTARDAGAGDCQVITACRPDLVHFEHGFRRRRET